MASIPKKNKKIEILYSSRKPDVLTSGIELPTQWVDFNSSELKTHAKQALKELIKHANSDLKAKELGFDNTEHLFEICVDYILN